jgi:hypothetical protein
MAKSPVTSRSAKEIIDQAINDNKWSEWLLYSFAILFVLAGILALIWGMIKGEGVVALAGAIAGVLFWPAMNQARQIRRENIAIRLLEGPLSMAATSEEAANALKEFFVNTFIRRQAQPDEKPERER